MDKIECLTRIKNTVENVKAIKKFEGKAKLLKKLNNIYDLVTLYNDSSAYYELCVKEAEMLHDLLLEDIKDGR
jgi:hypothetical protein